MADIVFVHGIGAHPRPEQMLPRWRASLLEGMRAAGHDDVADVIGSDPQFSWAMAAYGDLFRAPGIQGLGVGRADDDDEVRLAAEFLGLIIDGLDRSDLRPHERKELDSARVTLQTVQPAQRAGHVVGRLINASTTLLSLPGFRTVSGWLTGALMLGDLRQVSRYLGRGEPDDSSQPLDLRIRRRLSAHLDDSTVAVVAHSLGSVVAFETLHESPVQLPRLVTFGSPLALRSVVFERLLFPPRTPPGVAGWLNVWDKDDIIAIRPDLGNDFAPNSGGVVPRSVRIDSDGLWVHTATKYLAQPVLAGAIARAIKAR